MVELHDFIWNGNLLSMKAILDGNRGPQYEMTVTVIKKKAFPDGFDFDGAIREDFRPYMDISVQSDNIPSPSAKGHALTALCRALGRSDVLPERVMSAWY